MACEHHKWYSEKKCGFCIRELQMKNTLELIVRAKKLPDAKYHAKLALDSKQYLHEAWVIQS